MAISDAPAIAAGARGERISGQHDGGDARACAGFDQRRFERRVGLDRTRRIGCVARDDGGPGRVEHLVRGDLEYEVGEIHGAFDPMHGESIPEVFDSGKVAGRAAHAVHALARVDHVLREVRSDEAAHARDEDRHAKYR